MKIKEVIERNKFKKDKKFILESINSYVKHLKELIRKYVLEEEEGGHRLQELQELVDLLKDSLLDKQYIEVYNFNSKEEFYNYNSKSFRNRLG